MILPSANPKGNVALLMASVLLLCLGCAHPQEEATEQKGFSLRTRSVVIIGFRPLILPGRDPAMARNPLSGSWHYVEPVSQDVAEELTASLFSKLKTRADYQFISPGDARAHVSSLESVVQIADDLEMYQKIGQALSADAFLAGYIYRWRERKGADYGVDVPASVEFDLFLVWVDDKGVLWKGKYDKTQRSLTENLFDLHTFLKAKGKWLTASELAKLGLEDLMEKLPKNE